MDYIQILVVHSRGVYTYVFFLFFALINSISIFIVQLEICFAHILHR